MKILFGLVLSVMLLSVVGCFDPATSTTATNPAPNGQPAETAPAVTADEATPRETIGKTTQNVLDLKQALADGAVLASTTVESTNPLLQTADVYRTQVAKIAGMSVEQAIQLRNAQSIDDPKPLTYAQFVSEIIKAGQADGIQLPMLPYYQEYAWDEENQKLIAVDFPGRIAEREKQRNEN